MNAYKVELSRRATAQLQNIFSYIADDNPDAALRMIDKLEAKAKQLETAPFIGAELSQEEYPFLAAGYRRLVVSPFIMYYRTIEQTIYITHIIHEKRNQSKALAQD